MPGVCHQVNPRLVQCDTGTLLFASQPYKRGTSRDSSAVLPGSSGGKRGVSPDQLPTPAFGGKSRTGTCPCMCSIFRHALKDTNLSFSHLTLIVSLFTNDCSYFCAESRKPGARESKLFSCTGLFWDLGSPLGKAYLPYVCTLVSTPRVSVWLAVSLLVLSSVEFSWPFSLYFGEG